MTTLLIDELKTTLTQTITTTLNKRISLAGVRPYIYMHNAPSGTFTISIKDGVTVIASQTFTSADIKSDLSTSDSYAHIWKRLTFTNPIQLEKKVYTMVLSSSGYTFSETGYLAWIREHENQFNDIDYTPESDFYNPFSYQLFDYMEAI